MACFRPLPAFRDRAGGAPRIGYHAGEEGDKLELPCGRCIGCKSDRARSWAIRAMHEASLYPSNLFLTLDYAPDKLSSWSLQYRDFQLFMKRLRKEVRGVVASPTGKYPIRFFVSGEYGPKGQRPHWHALLFNAYFSDSVRYANDTYRSELAERCWQKGQVVIGSVTPASACYVAGYTLNKRYGAAAEDQHEVLMNPVTGELSSRRPEMCAMSRRPGIGQWWYDRFKSDLFPHDFAVTHDGRKDKVPRYYYERFRLGEDGSLVESVQYERYRRAKSLDPVESSPERRAVREAAAEQRASLFSKRAAQ